MKSGLVLCLAATLAACGDQTPPARGEARIALFKQCMGLAAEMPRQADDDVADVVGACATNSHYMTNFIK